MSGSQGRRDKAYLQAKALYQTGAYPCHICNERPGTTPDHVPPLHTAPHWKLWRGVLKPACRTCQNREGGRISTALQQQRTPQPTTSRHW